MTGVVPEEARELMNARLSLDAIAAHLAEEWMDHHVNGRTSYCRDINVLLKDNDRERKKIERKLRKKYGIRL